MKQKLFIIALGFIFTLTVALPLAAQQRTGQKYKNRYTKDLFNEADTNHDGYISWAEAKSVSTQIERDRQGRKRFNAADLDNDGRLSPKEARKYKGFEVRHRDEGVLKTKRRKGGAGQGTNEGVAEPGSQSGQSGTRIHRTKKELESIKRPYQKENYLNKKINTRKRIRNNRRAVAEH